VPEALILIGEQHVEIARIDVLSRRRQPPAAVTSDIGPEQLAVPVDHDGRKLDILAERGGTEHIDQSGDAAGDDRYEPDQADASEDGEAFPRSQPCLPLADGEGGLAHCDPPIVRRAACFELLVHFADFTLAVPVPVRPKRSGRYMSSMLACGSTYSPGDTARTI